MLSTLTQYCTLTEIATLTNNVAYKLKKGLLLFGSMILTKKILRYNPGQISNRIMIHVAEAETHSSQVG